MNSLSFAYLLVLLASCLIGSIPWGLIISRVVYKTDIREHGSGNIGTTNALRILGKKGGAAVFVLDFCKGLAAGLISLSACSFFWPGQPLVPLLGPVSTGAPAFIDANALRIVACVGAVLGHIFSPWLGFRGGKGIAVGVGCMFFAIGPVGTLVELAVFVLFVALTRYVSVGSLASAVACPLLALWLLGGSWLAIVLCVLVAAVVFWAHRANIRRLLTHSENRLGSKAVEEDGASQAEAASALTSDAPVADVGAATPADGAGAAAPAAAATGAGAPTPAPAAAKTPEDGAQK
ncbi:MAG: glycerol-3-phosphate 1-O-acyltransferase PlsY [Coriobacteriales bacterium]|jgi:glycerol-3-phosphate acyltransferase PlsY|nr:glycerol-3-phosphate 1-O-acyltransferase PlsY [Coriobacteriales bacterium]